MDANRLNVFLEKILPAVLALLVLYLYVSIFTEFKHASVTVIEYGLVGYFVAELGVKWQLAESWRDFLRKHWLKVVLILPFLRIFRLLSSVGVFGQAVGPWLRTVPYAQKLVKVPMMIKKIKPLAMGLLAYLSIRDRRRRKRGSAEVASPEPKESSQSDRATG